MKTKNNKIKVGVIIALLIVGGCLIAPVSAANGNPDYNIILGKYFFPQENWYVIEVDNGEQFDSDFLNFISQWAEFEEGWDSYTLHTENWIPDAFNRALTIIDNYYDYNKPLKIKVQDWVLGNNKEVERGIEYYTKYDDLYQKNKDNHVVYTSGDKEGLPVEPTSTDIGFSVSITRNQAFSLWNLYNYNLRAYYRPIGSFGENPFGEDK